MVVTPSLILISPERRRLIMPEAIKAIGEFDVPMKLHREVTAHVKVKVVAEGSQGS